jgi:serine/threonine protein kinase
MAKIIGERWEIIESLKEGGQRRTLKVKDLRDPTDSIFVLKRLKNSNRVNRFQREVEATLKLEPGTIVRPVFHDLEPKLPFYVTEYYEGGTLVNFLNPLWRSVGEKLNIFVKIADAVNYAHQQGVVHRAMWNIFIEQHLQRHRFICRENFLCSRSGS